MHPCSCNHGLCPSTRILIEQFEYFSLLRFLCLFIFDTTFTNNACFLSIIKNIEFHNNKTLNFDVWIKNEIKFLPLTFDNWFLKTIAKLWSAVRSKMVSSKNYQNFTDIQLLKMVSSAPGRLSKNLQWLFIRNFTWMENLSMTNE